MKPDFTSSIEMSCSECHAVCVSPEISFCPECLLKLFKDDQDILDISEDGDFPNQEIDYPIGYY